MTNDSYRTSHTAPGYGIFYDETIYTGYFGDLWRRSEAPLLRRWLEAAREAGARSALDFACGTGRVTEVVAQMMPEVVGVDVSREMLARARVRCPGVRFVEHDITLDIPRGLNRPQIITAFRFLQNAEPSLRVSALKALAQLLPPDGQLIVNVQCNADGPAGVVTRLRQRLLGHDVHSLSIDDVRVLLEGTGFEIIEVAYYGFWPRTGPYLPGLARRMQRPAERVVRVLRIPERYASQMFAVRARPKEAPPR